MVGTWVFLIVALCFTGAVKSSGKYPLNLKPEGFNNNYCSSCNGTERVIFQYVLISGASNRGRLLSPEEGCGIQPVDKLFLMQWHSNWPWMGSLLTPSDTKPLVSKCSKFFIYFLFGFEY